MRSRWTWRLTVRCGHCLLGLMRPVEGPSQRVVRLAIVDKAVQRMGGNCDIANALEGGLVVHIRLKRAP